jgi:hypothetical protein
MLTYSSEHDIYRQQGSIARKTMTVYIFRKRRISSTPLQLSLANVFSQSARDFTVWNFSTYYGTKSPDYKLTSKEALSIFCPHIFVGAAPICVKPPRKTSLEGEMEKIEGFAGLLRGKIDREHMLRLVRIVRRKREKLRATGNILELSVYDCIADGEKTFGLYAEESDFCDKFIERHVVFAKEPVGRFSAIA